MILTPGKYAILDEAGTTVVEIRIISETVEAKNGRAKPVVTTPKPSSDPATQKVIRSGWTINQSDVNPVWQVVALTQAELDVISQSDEATAIKPAIATFKAGTATNAQAQRAIGYLLKESIG